MKTRLLPSFFAVASLTFIAGAAAQQTLPLPEPKLDIISPDDFAAQEPSLESDADLPGGVSGEMGHIWRFLTENAENYRLSPDASNLKLISKKESLLGTHYHFQQVLGGIDVDRATIVVTTDKQGRVSRVYTSSIIVPKHKAARAALPQITDQQALAKSWEELGAQVDEKHGLYEEPSMELTYLAEESGFRLAWSVRLYVLRKRTDEAEAPNEPGLWRVLIDAISGEVIGEPERLSTNHKDAKATYDKRAGDLDEALLKLVKEKAEITMEVGLQSTVSGQGRVFDPDPLTTLQNAGLTDSSPAAAFNSAYQDAVLLQITKQQNTFHLRGPWVRLADFEPPFVAPSTTTNGIWTAKRGDVAFNDVMTYFHIDRSQRYIQSLGFNNIQAVSIVVDANGLSGADNSHYIPGSNRLAFGHGCVDDNEDADVILHEYGHAITHGISSQWSGGDTGAMGEGFGDYWAETSSYESPNGPTFQTFKTFDWDAKACWPGRRLDITASQATYDPSKTYFAHQSIGGGVQSDELWSTPLFKSYVELRESGVRREDIDRIVLQSMFGLGSGVKMRQLARSVVNTAKTLYPNGPQAGVFEKHFKALKILP